MQSRSFTLLLIAVAACGGLGGAAAGQEHPRLAPYPAIRWRPEVQIDGEWRALLSIDGVKVEEIIAFAERVHEGGWQKRFDEDLVQVLSEMGRPPGKTVTLIVRDVTTGKEITLDNVPLTAENRQAIMEFKRTRPTAKLNPDALRRALNDFRTALDQRWSYRHANQADFAAAIEKLRRKTEDGIDSNQFGVELQKIVALGIDGHAGVSGYQLPPGASLPFLVEPAGDRYVAFLADRNGLLAAGFPYLTAIDGRPMKEWIEAAAVLVPKGSPQYVRRQCLRHLRNLDYLREVMGLPKSAFVEVELSDQAGTSRLTRTLPVAGRPPLYGSWPLSRSRLLEGNIGYLRLAAMDDAAVEEIKTWMPKFRETAGLVVDVRDNGGGSRAALLHLYSYLAAPGDPPRVINVAAYRLHQEHRPDHLAQRFMYRADAKEWTAGERQAITAFAPLFQPAWQLPAGEFSDWHYMVLSRQEEAGIYHYTGPVVVLMNAKCFSATDVFLAGLKGMPKVTLLGTPSGGGSALIQEVALGGTPFELRIGSMASFQRDGMLFDGNGVRPDVVVEATPEYYIGGPDNVLAEAVKRVTPD